MSTIINPYFSGIPEEEPPLGSPPPLAPGTELLKMSTTTTSSQFDPAFFQSVIWNPFKATLFLVNSSGESEPNTQLVSSHNWDHVEFKLTIFLNEEVYFPQGEHQVTADDVAFSLNRLKTLAANFEFPWLNGFCLDVLNDVTVTVVDMLEVCLQFTQVWNPFFVENILTQPFTMIMSASADVNGDGTLNATPLFAGNYFVWDAGATPVTFVAHPDRGLYFNQIEVHQESDSLSLVSSAGYGNTDLAFENPAEPSAVQEHFSLYDPPLEEITSEFEEFVVLFNNNVFPFDNYGARMAVAYAFDREQMAVVGGAAIAKYDGTNPLKFLGVDFTDPFNYDIEAGKYAWAELSLPPPTFDIWIYDKLSNLTSCILADLPEVFLGCTINVTYGIVPPTGKSLYFIPVSQESSATRTFRDFAQLFYSGGTLGFNEPEFDNYIDIADIETDHTALMTDHFVNGLYHLANTMIGFCRLNTARVIRNFSGEGNAHVDVLDFNPRNPCFYNYGDLL